MKKISVIFLVLVLALSAAACGAQPKDVATDKTYRVSGSYEYLKEFLDGRENRTPASEGEAEAAQFLANKFADLGLTLVETLKFDISKDRQSQNVVGLIKGTSSDYQVIIGAHYDNVYGNAQQGSGVEGAYDNGTGIATMLAIINEMVSSQTKLPFDVVFVAFGAEEAGLLGSQAYVKNMTRGDISKTLLMVNLDVVGGGDYLYLYCDEVKTGHEEFLHAQAEKEGIGLNRPPANKKVYYADSGVLPYSHYGLSSDNLSFLNAKVNTASFFSVNWSVWNKAGVVESSKNPPIMHTPSDTLEKLEEMYGESFKAKMDAAASVVVTSLLNPEFKQAMIDSAANKFDYGLMSNSLLFNLIRIGLIAILFLLVFLLARHYTRKHPLIIIPRPEPIKRKVFDEYEDGPDSNDNPFEGY